MSVPFDVAAWVSAPSSIVNCVAVFCTGMLIDRGVDPARLLFVALLADMLAIIALVVQQPVSAPLGLLHGVLQGINRGIANTSKSAAYVAYFGHEHVGSILGVDKFVNIGGTAVGPVALAYLCGKLGSFANALRVSVLLPLLAAVLLCFSRKPQRRNEVYFG